MQYGASEIPVKLLLETSLFEGIAAGAVMSILECSRSAVTRRGKGGDFIREGERVAAVNVLIEGAAIAAKLDYAGRRSVAARLVPGSVFGGILAMGGGISPLTVTACEPSAALCIPTDYIYGRCGKDCAHHSLFLRNMLRVVSLKYFELDERLDCVLRPVLRDKIMRYLSLAAKKQGDGNFGIVRVTFDREAMADYLNADRSALSRELSAMKAEGLIDYHKNVFKLKYTGDMAYE